MIGITNQRAKRLWQQEFDRQLQVLERPYARKINTLFNKQFKDAMIYVAQGMTDGGSISHAIDKREREQVDLLTSHYKRIATVFGNKAFKIIEGSKFLAVPEIKTPMDAYWAEFNRWADEEAATKIRRIQKTTKANIATVVKVGMKEGESHLDIAKRIRKAAPVINPYRSKTIALTETHGAATRSVHSAVKSVRIQMEKEWVSAKDERTRTRSQGSQFEHFLSFPAGPDGERVGMDDKFQGTGEPMDYPGDTKGSAGNVIRCRCCCLYHPVQRERLPGTYTPEEGFLPAKDLDEAGQNFKKLFNISMLSTSKFKTTQSPLDVFNMVGKDLFRLKKSYKNFDDLIMKEPLKSFTVVYETPKQFGRGGVYFPLSKEIDLATKGVEREVTLFIKRKGQWGSYLVCEDVMGKFRHEFSHHIYNSSLGKKLEQEWEKIWVLHDQAWWGRTVSQYAGTNMNEAFAECFAAYTSPKYKMGMLPKEIEDYFVKVLGKKGK